LPASVTVLLLGLNGECDLTPAILYSFASTAVLSVSALALARKNSTAPQVTAATALSDGFARAQARSCFRKAQQVGP
jgi:hypothetical protein